MSKDNREIRKRDGRIVNFQQEKITNAIWQAMQAVQVGSYREAKLLSEKVTWQLEEKFFKIASIPSVEDIQDIVEEVLIKSDYVQTARAYIRYRKEHEDIRSVRELFKNIEMVGQYLNRDTWEVKENSNQGFSLQGMNNYIKDQIVSSYWLTKIYPPSIQKAEESGDFHIHDLGTLGPYTYYGKEVVIGRRNGDIFLVSLQELFDSIEGEVELLSKEDEAYAKYPKNLEVLDKERWVKVTRVVRKKKDRDMHFIKNEGGRSVIVTDNHPIIARKKIRRSMDKIDCETTTKTVLTNRFTEIEAQKVKEEQDETLTVELNKLLRNEKLFQKDNIYLAKELYDQGVKDFFLEGMPFEEYREFNTDLKIGGVISANNNADPLRNKINLTENLGYFIGFYLAEGSIGPHRVSIKQKNAPESKKILRKVKNGARGLGCRVRVYEREKGGTVELRIVNTTLVRYLFQKIFKLGEKSREKRLPRDILKYNKDFVRGVVAGVLDGDGSISSSGTSIILRTSSRTMLEQLSVVLDLLGFTPRDRSLEGVGSVREYKGKKLVQNYPLFGLGFRVLNKELPSFKYKAAELSSKAWRAEDPGWHKVLNNDKTPIKDEYIYDITTESGTLIVNGMWNHNCVGWDLKDLLRVGFRGARGKLQSKPAKHFDTALMQVVNFLYTLQGEAAGAQAFDHFDVYLAPYIARDDLDYKDVKQSMQKFLFNMNVPTRTGFQAPFTNITLDLNVPTFMEDEPIVMRGASNSVYGNYQREIDMLNRAFAEVMMEGDARDRPFSFPIPTINITPTFEWDREPLLPTWDMTAKYGIPYFANFINGDMKPEDSRSMCCRLRLDKSELKKRGGGLFGSYALTGSCGVVTINMPRIGYEASNEDEYFELLAERMDLAKKSLEIKRKTLERLTEKGLYPYSRFYLRDVKQRNGKYWSNHFSTIGLNGMNESLLNFMDTTIATDEGIRFSKKVLEFMRDKLKEYQEKTGDLWNLEATPAESTCYRLARKDKEKYPDIRIYNMEVHDAETPYYTNSTQLPVGHTDDLFSALKLQEPLQIKYTGGTVLHGFIGEQLPSGATARRLVQKVMHHSEIPYFTITPTFSVCPTHGYLSGEHQTCPKCNAQTEVYSRVVGYLRPVNRWNRGKQQEFEERNTFKTKVAQGLTSTTS